MHGIRPFSTLSLKPKLVLSYLAVAVGALLIVSIAVAFAVQSYFDNTQLDQLRNQAAFRSRELAYVYQRQGNSWGSNETFVRILSNDPSLLVVVDTKGNPVGCSQPPFLIDDFCHNAPTLQQALAQSLKGQSTDGRLDARTPRGTFSSLYVSVPVRIDTQIIGAMFLSTPQIYPNAFPNQVNGTIFVTVIIVSLIVLLLSLWLASRLTHPLKLLTEAAEQMKQGKYTQRVAPPKSQDELGRLALTFNEMADTIEADVNELRRQELARRELLANIAHDLATPLTAIQGFSEALADDMIPDPSARQETAQRIGREVQRLRRLVGDLQQMSSLESGHTQLDLAPLNIYTLVDETLSVIAPECEQQGVFVRNEIPPMTPLVRADSDRVTQVLLNLLDNARRHTPKNGSICVGARPKDTYLSIWVSDTGSGIDAADLPHIFERFYRADRSRTGSTGGSGLGLSIVKAIITAHGGTIRADSIPGKETRITFTLPLAQ